MTHLAPPSVRLLVCGNADRGDDGAALSAVATLLPSLPAALLERLEVRRCGHLRVEDLTDVPRRRGRGGRRCGRGDRARPRRDAAHPDDPRRTPSRPDAPLVARAARSTRSWGSPRRCGRAASREGTFVGIGGRRFGYGRPLSRSVRLNMASFQAAIAAELARLTHVSEVPRHRGRPAGP